ncbi:MAG: BLUF domain-containing protein [Burkholderiaceae bacterium]|jgi:hypothetical protein|nr:BLUF domain-containing protein [Pseudomonadota bacterium]MDP4618616.1 BLUF domain-containing protein [Burkholderiaceae bacterium]MDP4678314.1 BLUF domain-containing protein [Burkholderiaceae bacterium]MDP4740994.1 BLUF domain-containing protein [Burkholderiaceae bacterium]MDP4829448.1 BLUF domain-containing protein [Burkholderiaceae bacterium]
MPQSTLSTLVYHSRASQLFTEIDLLYLLAAARSRNQAEGLTGMLVYDDGHFFQWLEGPALPLQRVWTAIRHDARHEAIEVIADSEIPLRLFRDWHMQFAHRGGKAAQNIDGLILAPDDVVTALHQNPRRVPEILAEFSCLGAGPYARELGF